VGQVRGRVPTLGPFATVGGPGPNTSPRVGIGSDGTTVAVWDHASTVMAAVRSPAGRWSAPQQLSPLGRLYPAVRPDLAVNRRGDAVAIWTEQGPDYAYMARASYRPAGGAFGPPLDVSTRSKTYRTSDAHVAIADTGETAAVWTQDTPTTPVIMSALGQPSGWQPPTQLSPPAAPGQFASSGVVSMNAGAAAVAAWLFSTGSTTTPQASIRPVGGAFEPERSLASPQRRVFGTPQAGIDARGDAVVSWLRALTGTTVTSPLMRRPAGASSWQPLRGLASPGGRLAVAPNGAMVVAWGDWMRDTGVIRARRTSLRAGRPGRTIQTVTSGTPAYQAARPIVKAVAMVSAGPLVALSGIYEFPGTTLWAVGGP
jgi:hypothetical protein